MLNVMGLMWVKTEIREPSESCKFPSETGAWPEASELKEQGLSKVRSVLRRSPE